MVAQLQGGGQEEKVAADPRSQGEKVAAQLQGGGQGEEVAADPREEKKRLHNFKAVDKVVE